MLAIMTSNAAWRVLGAHLARIRDAMVRSSRAGHASLAVLLLVGGVAMVVIGAPTSSIGLAFTGPARGPATGPATPHSVRTDPEEVREILDTYCVRCHNETRLNGGLALDVLDVENPIAAADRWETVIRKLRTGTMPPGGVRRPDPAEYDLVASWLETEIDGAASAAGPNPAGPIRSTVSTASSTTTPSTTCWGSTWTSGRFCPVTRRRTAASTISPTPSPSRPLTWSGTCRWRVR